MGQFLSDRILFMPLLLHFFAIATQLAIEISSKTFLLFALLILSGVLKRDISETPGLLANSIQTISTNLRQINIFI